MKQLQEDLWQSTIHSMGTLNTHDTPGHTAGSICFFYKSPYGKSYLFTGDTIFQSNAKWATLAFPRAGGSKASLAESLLRLRDLKPDVVMCSAFVGDVSVVEVVGDAWAQAIDDNVSRLRKES